MKQALQLLKNLEFYGYEAYLVGGFVRDYYLGKENPDIDICTNATPAFLKEHFCVLKDYSEYGSVQIQYQDMSFEVTTFRKDIYHGNRYPEIQFVDTLLEDLQRRDFTINTLCMDARGNYVDLLNAKQDLDHRIIKMVGNPSEKINEDPLRMIRALRFQVMLSCEMDADLQDAIQKNGFLLKKITVSRIQKEISKITNENDKKQFENLLIKLDLKRFCA